jgi:hypothetical protein
MVSLLKEAWIDGELEEDQLTGRAAADGGARSWIIGGIGMGGRTDGGVNWLREKWMCVLASVMSMCGVTACFLDCGIALHCLLLICCDYEAVRRLTDV